MDTKASMQAKNVTIVTVDGMVTLKGTVPTAEEKTMVGNIAQSLAPNVRNELAVKK